MTIAADDPEAPTRVTAFAQGLAELGWTAGRNLQIDYRWGGGDPVRYHRYAAELVALAPDVILGVGGTIVAALQQATRTVPIVFVSVVDPVGAGLVASLARPGGTTTGFMNNEYGTSGKWVELLREVAPEVTRTAVMRDPAIATAIGQFAVIQSAASSVGLEVTALIVRDAGEIERAVTQFGRRPNGSLIVTASALGTVHRDLIIRLAAQYRLPAVYPYRFFATDGGLMAYGPDTIDQYRQAAGYVDRILKGEKPADLPVLQPTKFELAINLKTAKALGLTVPPSLLAIADEVIEE